MFCDSTVLVFSVEYSQHNVPFLFFFLTGNMSGGFAVVQFVFFCLFIFLLRDIVHVCIVKKCYQVLLPFICGTLFLCL